VKFLARHLTVDLYNCQASKLQDQGAVEEVLNNDLRQLGYRVLNISSESLSEHHFAFMVLFDAGHLVLHVYQDLRYVAIDIFLCHEEPQPEPIYQQFQKFFRPDKTKTTLLKRGDFGKDREIKPKIKTRVAPLRKIHNTGAKVIRILARRKQQ